MVELIEMFIKLTCYYYYFILFNYFENDQQSIFKFKLIFVSTRLFPRLTFFQFNFELTVFKFSFVNLTVAEELNSFCISVLNMFLYITLKNYLMVLSFVLLMLNGC